MAIRGNDVSESVNGGRAGVDLVMLAAFAAVAATFIRAISFTPVERLQGPAQKIFYVHVPLAIVALIGFIVAGVLGAMHLRTRDDRWDQRSYVAIHMGVIFGVGVLLTGAIWARASWGKWWVWDEPTLVSFLIVFLLYVTYYPLRYSIEDPAARAVRVGVRVTAGALAGHFTPCGAESLVPRGAQHDRRRHAGEMVTF